MGAPTAPGRLASARRRTTSGTVERLKSQAHRRARTMSRKTKGKDQEIEMSTSGRINPDFPAMEGPDELTEDDYADFWIPEFDEEFADMSMMENLKAVVGDRKRGDDPAKKKKPE